MFVILLSMQSCIRDDRSDCKDSALRLAFRYTLNNQHTDLLESEVTRVTVYVFDAANKYVGTYTESGNNLKNKYVMTISLPEGRYQAIVFCDNLNTFTTSVGRASQISGLCSTAWKIPMGTLFPSPFPATCLPVMHPIYLLPIANRVSLLWT